MSDKIKAVPCPQCGAPLEINIDCHHEQELAAKDKEIAALKDEIRQLEHPGVHLSAKWFSNENEKLAKLIIAKNDEIAMLREALGKKGVQLDALLNHCDKGGGECGECSKIICPHKDEMHFHHDGCPSCCQDEAFAPREGEE